VSRGDGNSSEQRDGFTHEFLVPGKNQIAVIVQY